VIVWLAVGADSFGPARAFAVGHRPSAFTVGSFDERRTVDLAVADGGSDAVSLLFGDGRGGVRRRVDVPVGRTPVDVAAVSDEFSLFDKSLDEDDRTDLVVADAGSDDVAVLLGSAHGPRRAAFVRLPAGSRPVALTVGRFKRHGHLDVAVAQSGSGAVTVLAGDGRGSLRPQAPVLLGGTPNAIGAFDFAGDELDDLVVGDATGALRTVILGDRTISPARGADQLNAQDGAVYWSQRGAHGWQEMRWTPAAGARPLPIPSSAKSVFLHLGRDPRGRREGTFARCAAARRCRVESLVLATGRVRTVRVPGLPAGCRVADLARWRRVEAYVLASTHAGSCGRSHRGLWARAPDRPPRRLAATLVALGDVHGRVIGWSDGHRLRGGAAVVRLRAARADGPVRTLDFGVSGGEGCDDGLELGGPLFDDGHLYWNESCASSVGGGFNVLKRAPVGLRRRCVSFISDIVSGAQLGFDWAVDRGHVYYAGDRGGHAGCPRPAALAP
jgi:hypothetical protein